MIFWFLTQKSKYGHISAKWPKIQNLRLLWVLELFKLKKVFILFLAYYRVSQNAVSTLILLYSQLTLHLGINAKAFIKSVWHSLLESVQKLCLAQHIKQNILWQRVSIHFQKWQIYFIIWLDSWSLWLTNLIMRGIIVCEGDLGGMGASLVDGWVCVSHCSPVTCIPPSLNTR